jgi:hypothetical protein
MRFLPLLFSVVLTATSFGADDYLPLAVGNEWVMDAVLTSPAGEVSKTTARRRTGGTTEHDGKVYHRVVTALEGPNASAYTKLHRKDETGYYSVDVRDENAKEQTEVVLPLKIGQSWKRTSGAVNLTDTVIAQEDVTINGKTYEKCFHIRVTTTDGSYTEDYWEAPGVGCVKSETVFGNGGKISLTLRSFKSGK